MLAHGQDPGIEFLCGQAVTVDRIVATDQAVIDGIDHDGFARPSRPMSAIGG